MYLRHWSLQTAGCNFIKSKLNVHNLQSWFTTGAYWCLREGRWFLRSKEGTSCLWLRQKSEKAGWAGRMTELMSLQSWEEHQLRKDDLGILHRKSSVVKPGDLKEKETDIATQSMWFLTTQPRVLVQFSHKFCGERSAWIDDCHARKWHQPVEKPALSLESKNKRETF